MRQRFFSAVFLFTAIFFLQSEAQNPEPVFRHYTIEDGLPSSQVYEVMQDANGYVWFGTDRGVVKYNGYEFKTFTTKDGLTDNTVFKLFQDEKKRIWMLSFSGSVFIYEHNKITPYKYNSQLNDFMKGSVPWGIYVDADENVFVSSDLYGAIKIDKNGKVADRFLSDSDKKNNIFLMKELKKNNFLLGYSHGISNNPLVMLYYISDIARDDFRVQVPGLFFRGTALRLKNKQLIFSSGKILYELRNKTAIQLAKPPDNIVCFFEDNKRQLLIGTVKGLYVYSKPNDFVECNKYLSDKYIGCIAQDKEGGYWITTIDDGVYYLINDAVKNFISNDTLKSSVCLASDFKSKIYTRYWDGSIASVSAKGINLICKYFEATYSYNLFFDSASNKLYSGSNKSAYLKDDIYYPLKSKLNSVCPIGFIRTNHGVFSGNSGVISKIVNDSCLYFSPLKVRINCIGKNENDEILLGCRKGVYKFDERDTSISLISEKVKDVRVDDITLFNGNLCFATRGQGLLMMNEKDSTIRSIDERNGLCSNLIHKLKVSGNKIWCASYNGISEISFSDFKNFKYTIVNIGSGDGLSSNEINDLCILNDTVWVASKKGISFFNEHTDFLNHVAPVVHFTSFRINNVDTTLTDNYKFSHEMNTIRIGFEAVSFKSDAKIFYQYILTNATDSITDRTTNREVEFLLLKPGDYTLQIKAINNSGGWNVEPATLRFSILAPFWQTGWFILLVVLLTGFSVFYLVRTRIARIRRQEGIKTEFNKQLVSLELKSLRAQMNPHFIFNVMNSIQDYILKNDAKSAQKYLTKFARLVRLILNSSVEGEILLSDELNAATLYVELEQQRFDKQFDFIPEVDEEVDTENILLPSMMVQPYLENAIKHGLSHTDIHGKLFLKIKKQANAIIIFIEDNGAGRDASAAWNKKNVREHVSHGTMITAKRIDAYNIAHNTNIQTSIADVKDENGFVCGTRVEIIVPLKYKT